MKTLEKIIVIAVLVFLPINLLVQPYEGKTGDVDNNGNINVLDMLIIVNYRLGIVCWGEQEFWRADCNSSIGNCDGDGNVNILDIVKIANIILGLDECPEMLTDIDGNIYQTVTIGTQEWMAENLKVTRYRNGDPIPNVTSNPGWNLTTKGAYCDYDNDADNVTNYGRLYNWYTVDDIRGIAPEGWHVPNDEELKQLEMYLGMNQSQADSIGWRGTDEGGKMKITGTIQEGDGLWYSPNTGATNESGFSALPGGYRYNHGSFDNMIMLVIFWSSTEYDADDVWCRGLLFNNAGVYCSVFEKRSGFSVRCIKD